MLGPLIASQRCSVTYWGSVFATLFVAAASPAWAGDIASADLPEVVTVAEVIGVVHITDKVELPAAYFDHPDRRAYVFKWLDVWRRSPFAAAPSFEATYVLVTSPSSRQQDRREGIQGRCLVFGVQSGPREYLGITQYDVLPVDAASNVEWWWDKSGRDLITEPRTVTLAAARDAIAGSMVKDHDQALVGWFRPDREPFDTLKPWHLDHHRMIFGTSTHPEPSWGVTGGFPVVGYVHAGRVRQEASDYIMQEADEYYTKPGRRRYCISGRWQGGSFLVLQIEDMATGTTLLEALPGDHRPTGSGADCEQGEEAGRTK